MSLDYTPVTQYDEPLNPDRVFQGLTAKQEAYAYARYQGLSQSEAFCHAYDKKPSDYANFYRDASLLDRNPKVVARVRQLVEENRVSAGLFPQVSQELVTNGILGIAMLGEKESNRLAAWVHLGKMAGIDLFRETTRVEHVNRTPEDVERELKAKLSEMMKTIEGSARPALEPGAAAPAAAAKPAPADSAPRADRRRKPAPRS